MIRYTLRQLEYLVACAEYGSVAKAAAALNVSQPTVSAAIAKLEATFGVQLLLRHRAQGVSPTAGAEAILHSARALLAHATDLQREATEAGNTVAGTLRAGSFSTFAPVILPGLLARLGQAYPGISVAIREGTQETLCRDLQSGTLDVALLYDLDLPDDLHREPLAERMPHVALPTGHRLAAQADVGLADLVAENLILLDVPPSREYFLGLFRAAGLVPTLAFSSPSLELVRGMVGRGMGYSILVTRPEGDTTYDGHALAIRPLRDAVTPGPIVLARPASLRPTRLIAAFEQVARACLTE